MKRLEQEHLCVFGTASSPCCGTHLDRVETQLEDSVQHAAVEALLLLQVLLQLQGNGVQAQGAVPLLTPLTAGQQILNHHSTQALPVCIQPASVQHSSRLGACRTIDIRKLRTS